MKLRVATICMLACVTATTHAGAALAAPSASALPALGQTHQQTAQLNQKNLASKAAVAGWSVMQDTAQGITVNRYLTTQGQVFAVTWQGPVKPNLQELLGAYFPQSALAPRVDTHSALQNSGADLVFASQGALGRLTGYAYLQSLLPAGFDLQNLK